MRVFIPLLVLVLACHSGCTTKARYESYGLRSVEIRMDDEDVGGLYGGAAAHVDFPATVVIDGEEFRARVKGAGATSVRNPRKSLTLTLNEGSFRDAKKIRLAAAVGDRSMIRPLLGFEALVNAGIPTPWAEPVFVHLNERILGLYIAVETIEDEFFESRGIAWERVFEAKGDADFGKSFEGRLGVAFDSKPNPNDPSAMLALLRTLDIADDAAFTAAIFRVLDRSAVVNYMAANQVINNFDGFNKNLFYIQDPETHLMRLAPWDLDLSWPGRTGDAWNLNVLFSRIGRIIPLRTEIDARITTLLAGPLAKSVLLARLEAFKTQIASAYDHDPWLGRGGRSLDEEAAALAQLVSDRIDSLP